MIKASYWKIKIITLSSLNRSQRAYQNIETSDNTTGK